MLLNIVFTFLQALLFSVCHFGYYTGAMVLVSMSNVLKSLNASAKIWDLIAQENGYEGKSAHKNLISGLQSVADCHFTMYQGSYVTYIREKITAKRIYYFIIYSLLSIVML